MLHAVLKNLVSTQLNGRQQQRLLIFMLFNLLPQKFLFHPKYRSVQSFVGKNFNLPEGGKVRVENQQLNCSCCISRSILLVYRLAAIKCVLGIQFTSVGKKVFSGPHSPLQVLEVLKLLEVIKWVNLSVVINVLIV